VEYYIYNVPVFVVDEIDDPDIVREFCAEAETYVAQRTLHNVEVVYIGNFKDLRGRNAAYTNGAIYMTATEPTSHDMLENFVHEVAHSLESTYGLQIYTDELRSEFIGKRQKLKHLLNAQGFEINPILYDFAEYNQKFDEFLADEVGYPTLLNITMGLFASPYGATSLQEYFANGFEKYILENPRTVRDVSPVLYNTIEEILDDKA
jgi:hypothetical protein